jgi:hypothetical protein
LHDPPSLAVTDDLTQLGLHGGVCGRQRKNQRHNAMLRVLGKSEIEDWSNFKCEMKLKKEGLGFSNQLESFL